MQLKRVSVKVGKDHTYNYIKELFELLKDGDERIGVHGFGNEPFEKNSNEFFIKNKISDEYLNKAVLELAFAHDEEERLQFIDYKRLSADHLGSIFEGLLEFNLEVADKDYAVENNKLVSWEKLAVNKRKILANTKVNKGELYLTNTNRERKNTGSYYTPDFLVDYVLKGPLQKMCNDKDINNILALKVCDPSMGSAHFLLGVVRNIEEVILEKMESGEDESTLTVNEVRKAVLHSCVYGVDINPLSVELAKFSLWIYTAKKGESLEPLADQLKSGDSLVSSFAGYSNNFNWEKNFPFLKEEKGFDLVVGNPPWDKLKATDLDFFRYYSQDYAMQTDADKEKLKKKLLSDLSINAHYERYKLEKAEMVEYLKQDKFFKNQVIELDGRKISGDTNKYKYFFEQFYNLTKAGGYYGVILPHSFISDTGASGLRKLLLEESSLEKAVSFQNETNGVKAFQGVASNVKVCGIIAQKGGKTKVYSSKFLTDFSELIDEGSFMKVNQAKFGKVFGDYRNIICFKDKEDLDIHDRLNSYSLACEEVEGIDMSVKSGEADMTNKKKFFTATKTKYPLITGREFSPFSKINNPGKYVLAEFASTVNVAKERRVVIKAIMPDSIKKVQATIVPKDSILSNNLFSVSCMEEGEEDMLVLTALLNSELMEYRIRCFLSNFRLTHRNLYQLPISKSVFKKLSNKKFIENVEKLIKDPKDEKALKKMNDSVFEAFAFDEKDMFRIRDYIFGQTENSEGEDSDEIAA